MKNKAFSLAELMVALSIMAVISAVLIPSLTRSLPNEEKYKFKTAYSILSEAVSELINDPNLYPNGTFQHTDLEYFCKNLADKLNTTYVDCEHSPPTDFPIDIITTNGIRLAGVKVGGYFDNAAHSNQIRMYVVGDGPNEEGEDWFYVTIFDNGKIVVDTTKGNEYLQED